MLFFLILSALPATFSVWLQPTAITAVSQRGVCVDLWAFLVPGNNVMRTIHGVGEMMTQMVLSRGSIFPMSVPDIQPSLHPSKQGSPTDHEDVTVMDTTLRRGGNHVVFLELRRDSRVTTGNSGFLLCWPRKSNLPFNLSERAVGCSRVTSGCSNSCPLSR